MTDWREHILRAHAARAHEKRPEFRKGASPERLRRLEDEVGLRIPTPLRELLRVSDGVEEELLINGEWMITHASVWTCDEIETQNLALHFGQQTPLAPAESPGATPFYFAGAGVDGILFAFLVDPSDAEDPAVYGYYPMEREWSRISPSLEEHLRGWKV